MLWSDFVGRHILTETVSDTFIPNDTEMLEESGRIQVWCRHLEMSQRSMISRHSDCLQLWNIIFTSKSFLCISILLLALLTNSAIDISCDIAELSLNSDKIKLQM